jgi:hypothetical protein
MTHEYLKWDIILKVYWFNIMKIKLSEKYQKEREDICNKISPKIKEFEFIFKILNNNLT